MVAVVDFARDLAALDRRNCWVRRGWGGRLFLRRYRGKSPDLHAGKEDVAWFLGEKHDGE